MRSPRVEHPASDLGLIQGLYLFSLQVSTCLASIAQGVHTKSRAWVARRTPQQQIALSAGQQYQYNLSRSSTFSQNSPFGMFTAGDAADGEGAGSLVDGLLGMARTMAGKGASLLYTSFIAAAAVSIFPGTAIWLLALANAATAGGVYQGLRCLLSARGFLCDIA